MDIGDVFLRLVPDASRFRRETETKVKEQTAGLSTTVTVKVDDKGTIRSFVSRMTSASKATDTTTASVTSLGGSAMPALAAAGVALSPIIATVGTGLGGLGLAAYGVAKPISDAAGKAGGLRKNLAALDPEQRAVAKSLLVLQGSYDRFQKSLAPSILADFNRGLGIARTLLRGVQPVALATGKALGLVLGEIDAEFRSQTWQDFFGFMAREAGPDVRLLGQNLTDLMRVLPPLLQDLQPLGRGFLVVSDDALKAAHGVTSFYDAFQRDVPISNLHVSNALRDVDHWVTSLTNRIPGARAVNDWLTGVQHGLDGTASSSKPAASGLAGVGKVAGASAPKVQSMAAAVAALTTAQDKALSVGVAYAGSLVTTKTDALALAAALKASHDKIGLHTAAQRNSFSIANQYILDLANEAKQAIASGKGASGAAAAIARGLPILDRAKTKSHAYWTEVSILKGWLDRLRAEKAIHEQVFVTGQGQWAISQGIQRQLPGKRAAAGWLVRGGIPGKDSVPILATPGEAIVPKHLTPAVAPFLKAHGVPGFAAGGIVPSYVGGIPGLKSWTLDNRNATIRSITASIASSMAQSFAAAFTGGFGGGFGASALVAQAFARSLFPAHGWSMAQWPPLLALWNGESGWNASARNPSSGAAGIPQDITGNFHGGYKGQVIWGENYIDDRYRTPGAAYAAWLSRSPHWYDRGGWVPPGLSLSWNGTGRPERVLPPGHGYDGPLFGDVNVYDATDYKAVEQQLTWAWMRATP